MRPILSVTLSILAALVFASPLPHAHAGHHLTIAAAADTQFAMRDLIARFERQNGAQLRLVVGSSGNLTSQIEQGAPFDLLFSADLDHPQKLEHEGLAVPGSLRPYALGRLVVFVPSDSPLDFERQGLKSLASASVQKIAIANPRFAPYGRAAVVALRYAGLYDSLQPKLVLGEDVSQASQFVASGNAQAAFTALALMLAPGRRPPGRYWIVPPEDYPPLEQAVVIVQRSTEKNLARSFLHFLGMPPARAILARYGFAEPSGGPR